MKSILIVTEQFTLGGLETHIRGEIQQLTAQGFAVHLVVGEVFESAFLPSCVSTVTHGIKLGLAASAGELLAAIEQLRSIIRKHQIQALHVHPFTSIMPAVAAAELEKIPYAITLHGPASLASYGPIYDFILKDVILPSSGFVVAVSPEVKRLVLEFSDPRSVVCIYNSVNFDEANTVPHDDANDDPHWLAVSRLDEFKIQGLLDFCIKAHGFGIPGVRIAGDGPARQRFVEALEEHGLSDFVMLLGARTDLAELIRHSSGVAGMGRVVLEAVAALKPVVLVGYDGVKGIIDPSLLKISADSNFSGRGLPTLSIEDFSEQLRTRLRHDSILENFSAAKEDFEESKAWRLFSERLFSTETTRRTAITGLYHSLAASRIDGDLPYLHSLEIIERLAKVVCSKNYYDSRLLQSASLCRQQLQNEMHGRTALGDHEGQIASLNQAVADRDGLIVSLNQKVVERDEEITKLNNEMVKMRQSISWRITSPLRFAKDLGSSPKRTAKLVIHSLFWYLPVELRKALQGQKYFLRRLSSLVQISLQNPNSTDLSWSKFNERVLANRQSYKGVFIQEKLALDWNAPLYQRPQHICTALGQLGYLVIYRTGNLAGDNVNGFREVAKNVWITDSSKVEEIQDCVRSVYSTAFVNTPESLMKNGKRGKLIYEYIDHIDPEISGNEANIMRLFRLKEFAFRGGADFILASAKKLYDEAVQAVGKDSVILVANGVDVSHYRNVAHSKTAVPESLVAFKSKYKTIVGYFGALAPWLWYDVITELAKMRPDIGFVFIGPDYYGGAQNLPKSHNILYMGAVDYKILPAYAANFDVCFIPFKPGEIAKTTSPLKLFEYFALEKPVVVTSDMDECTVYRDVFRGGSPVELSNAIDNALKIKDQDCFKIRIRELADRNDWTNRVHDLEVCFEELSAIFVTRTIDNLQKSFGVSQAFLRQYRLYQNNVNWSAISVDRFLGSMNDMTRMHTMFALSCVQRGQAMVDMISSTGLLQSNQRYLDVGTGYGGFPVAFANAGFEQVVGIELQDHLVELAKANVENLSNAWIYKRNIVEDSVDDLGLFDFITCNDVIEHVSDPDITLKKLASMLRASGVICLEIPNKDCITWIISDGHFQIFALTLLERDVAGDYYSEVLPGYTKENYLKEMGISYPLQWYVERLGQNGVKTTLLDTSKVCEFEDFPSQIRVLEERYSEFKSEAKSALSPVVYDDVVALVAEYLNIAKREYDAASSLQERELFVNKYLRTFWTLVGVKK